jgi:uncharacterized protein
METAEEQVRWRPRRPLGRGEPLFVADWERVLMIHFEVDPNDLQQDVPFELDLWEGRGFVSLVAFTMCGLRPHFGGRALSWILRPIATHGFLNVRTYVRHDGEAGIQFLAEWLDNPLSVPLGPLAFGLPYRLGRLDFRHQHELGAVSGNVKDGGGRGCVKYRAELSSAHRFDPCKKGTLPEFLMERYTAFTCWGTKRRLFRVWHSPWLQCEGDVELQESSLVRAHWPWFREAKMAGANYSPGVRDVGMGWPHRCR